MKYLISYKFVERSIKENQYYYNLLLKKGIDQRLISEMIIQNVLLMDS